MMSERELLDLCNDIPLRNVPFESAECYGIGRHLRKYGFYPQWLPLIVSTDHGPSQRDTPTLLELRNNAPVMLYHSKRLVLEWRKKSAKPCYVMPSPFVFYRKKNKICRANEARGTLAFPVHSTDRIENEYDIEKYIKSLLSLPSEFQPIGACLYYLDIKKGTHKIFQKYGVPVFTAGHIYNKEFTERFYDILKNYKYATSNHLGSYALYAIEIGMPFFVYGEQASTVNKGDPNCPDGKYDPSEISHQFKKMRDLFDGISKEIRKDQKKLVESELGIADGISRTKMAYILYSSLLKWLYPRTKERILNLVYQCYKLLPDAIRNIIRKNYFLFREKYYLLGQKYYLFKESLNQEAKIITHLVDAEKIALHSLAKQLRPAPVAVEIGSYLGASSCFIANGVKKNKGVLYCIDTWQNQDMPEGERDTLNEFMKNTGQYRDVIQPLRGWSSEIAVLLKQRVDKIDLLFIDGDHSYEACKSDWENYSPFLKKDSLIVFHDTGWADGVKQVVAESVMNVADKILDLRNMQAFKVRK